MYTFSGEIILSKSFCLFFFFFFFVFFFLPPEKWGGSTLKGKNLLLLEANSFLLEKSTYSEVACCARKVVTLVKHSGKSTVYPFPLIIKYKYKFRINLRFLKSRIASSLKNRSSALVSTVTKCAWCEAQRSYKTFILEYKNYKWSRVARLRKTACIVVNPIIIDSFVSLFNCTKVGRSSD